jgi:hypothetical protein
MTQFIVMSINRSQDYAKLTSNIALKPKLETVSVPDVLRFVSKCMSHQNNGRIIVVHSLVCEIGYCSFTHNAAVMILSLANSSYLIRSSV